MLSDADRQAIREHAAVIEAYEAARKKERDRLREPYREQALQIGDKMHSEGLVGDGRVAASLTWDDPRDIALLRSATTAIEEGLAAFDAAHRPNHEPFDTPRKLVAWIDEEFRWWERHSEGLSRKDDPPRYPDDEARAAYREARRRALAFARIAPTLREEFSERLDPIVGLQDIRTVFASLIGGSVLFIEVRLRDGYTVRVNDDECETPYKIMHFGYDGIGRLRDLLVNHLHDPFGTPVTDPMTIRLEELTRTRHGTWFLTFKLYPPFDPRDEAAQRFFANRPWLHQEVGPEFVAAWSEVNRVIMPQDTPNQPPASRDEAPAPDVDPSVYFGQRISRSLIQDALFKPAGDILAAARSLFRSIATEDAEAAREFQLEVVEYEGEMSNWARVEVTCAWEKLRAEDDALAIATRDLGKAIGTLFDVARRSYSDQPPTFADVAAAVDQAERARAALGRALSPDPSVRRESPRVDPQTDQIKPSDNAAAADVVPKLDNVAAGLQVQDIGRDDIPVDRRSRIMTLWEAGSIHSGKSLDGIGQEEKKANGRQFRDSFIKSKFIKSFKISREQWYFDIEGFPPHVRDRVRPDRT
jgi:hypothetical protein